MPISALNQYAYCPRRCYLIHVEGEFVENVHTVQGSYEHSRVDEQKHQTMAGVRVEYGLPVWSDRLKLSGRCDVVEFHAGDRVYPIEYKHGKRRKWINDDLQLAAQAVCLEEMLGISIEEGAIFHQRSRRRREVAIDSALREEVIRATEAVHALINRQSRPAPTKQTQRCPECSLRQICQPELSKAERALRAQRIALFEIDDDVS
ncbi:MAG: CRISPR-associated protein Cas4 [Gammaproteobacteria bacterium]